MKTKIVNLYHDKYDIYIGRAGRGKEGYYGNPFFIKSDISREETIKQFSKYFTQRINKDSEFKKRILELKGKTLGCFCKPSACHGDIVVDWLEHGGK